MEYRTLGNSDLNISVITLGSWLTYGATVDEERTKACVDRAFDHGINFFDTANVYAHGGAEEVLGNILSKRPRNSYMIATKLFWAMSPEDEGLSAVQIEKQCEASLRRLQVDVIDLYQAHRYDVNTLVEETMQAFTKLIEQGKVRYIGFSEWTAKQIADALAIPNVARFVSSQPQYSMLHRVPEAEVIPLCRKEGISQIVWSPLAEGVLTGKYLPGEKPPPDSRGADEELYSNLYRHLDTPGLLEAVQQLRPIADELGMTMAQMAIAWILREENLASVIVGATKPEQLDDNVGALGKKIPEDALVRIDDVLKSFVTWSY